MRFPRQELWEVARFIRNTKCLIESVTRSTMFLNSDFGLNRFKIHVRAPKPTKKIFRNPLLFQNLANIKKERSMSRVEST